MKWWTRFAAVTVLSIAIAGGLSLMPRLEQGNVPEDKTVQGRAAEHLLSSDNLVDRLTELDLYLDIRHVDWNSPVLAIDFASPAAVDIAAVYQDLYKLSRYSLADTRNVEEFQARVYAGRVAGSAAKSPLLLSLDARREDAIVFKLDQNAGASAYQEFLETYCRLAATQKWRDMLSRY